MAKRDRTLYVLKYLWQHTDEQHPTTVAEIIAALFDEGIRVERHALMADMERLSEFGVDIVCVKSSPKRYYIGKRPLTLDECKLLSDAVGFVEFVSVTQRQNLLRKLCCLTSIYQAEDLKQCLSANSSRVDRERVKSI
jgi:hypothetical protein